MAIKDLSPLKTHFFVCNGGSCLAAGADQTILTIRKAIIDEDKSQEIHTTKTLCNGRCEDAPVVIAMPDNLWFRGVTPELGQSLVKGHHNLDSVSSFHVLFKFTVPES